MVETIAYVLWGLLKACGAVVLISLVIAWPFFLMSVPTILVLNKVENKKFNCPKCDSVCHFVAFHNVLDIGSAFFECESCHTFFNSSAKEITDFASFGQVLP